MIGDRQHDGIDGPIIKHAAEILFRLGGATLGRSSDTPDKPHEINVEPKTL
jgi:hypothetical protein